MPYSEETLANKIHTLFIKQSGNTLSLSTEMSIVKRTIIIQLGWYGFITGIIVESIASIWAYNQ